MYVSDYTDLVDQYSAFGGPLTPLTPPSATLPGSSGGFQLAISPDSRYVYVILDSGGIGTFRVGWNGTLSAGGPVVPADAGENAITVSPDGRSVYVTSYSGLIWQYDVGPHGALTPKTPASIAAGTLLDAVAVSPDGRSLYVTNIPSCVRCHGDVLQFDIGRRGLLSPSGNPSVATGISPEDIVVSPDGRSVYVSADGLDQFNVGPGGALSPKNPASTGDVGITNQLAVSPDGRSLYVTLLTDTVGARFPSVVYQYTIGSGGLLSPETPAYGPAGRQPQGIAVSPNGRHVYVANSLDNTVSQYDVGRGGVLTPETTATVATGDGPVGVVVADPSDGG